MNPFVIHVTLQIILLRGMATGTYQIDHYGKRPLLWKLLDESILTESASRFTLCARAVLTIFLVSKNSITSPKKSHSQQQMLTVRFSLCPTGNPKQKILDMLQ